MFDDSDGGLRQYKTVALPPRLKTRGKRGRGPAESVAEALSSVINAQAERGWRYLRAETVRALEGRGWFRQAEEAVYTVLVFDRPAGSDHNLAQDHAHDRAHGETHSSVRSAGAEAGADRRRVRGQARHNGGYDDADMYDADDDFDGDRADAHYGSDFDAELDRADAALNGRNGGRNGSGARANGNGGGSARGRFDGYEDDVSDDYLDDGFEEDERYDEAPPRAASGRLFGARR